MVICKNFPHSNFHRLLKVMHLSLWNETATWHTDKGKIEYVKKLHCNISLKIELYTLIYSICSFCSVFNVQLHLHRHQMFCKETNVFVISSNMTGATFSRPYFLVEGERCECLLQLLKLLRQGIRQRLRVCEVTVSFIYTFMAAA